jgi:hypothetical protein
MTSYTKNPNGPATPRTRVPASGGADPKDYR